MYSLKNSTIEPDTISIKLFGWNANPPRQAKENQTYTTAEEGYQKIQLGLKLERHAKICADGTVLDQSGFNYGFYDYYTGAWLHPTKEAKNGEDVFTFDLEIEGTTYTIECTNTFNRGTGPRTEQEDGSTLIDSWLSDNYEFKVPFEYDGLVFGILPRRDGRGANVNEDGEFVINLSEEANFEEGIYFRINGSVDPWMVR